MSKRGRKSSWWGWPYWKKTTEISGTGHPLYQCQVPVETKVGGELILCCELVAHAGSPTSLKNHFSGKHRDWQASKKIDKSDKKEKKQPRIDQGFVSEKKELVDPSKRVATAEEIAEMEADLLSVVVDDLRSASTISGILYHNLFLIISLSRSIGKGFFKTAFAL